MRIVAAFGIVWFHMQAPGLPPGLQPLPPFLMLAGALSFRSAARETPLAFWLSRARRLLGPWLLWCLVCPAVDAWRFGWREALTLDQPLSLLIGPSIHLWFLPVLLLASGLAPAARRLLPGGWRLGLAATLLGTAFALPLCHPLLPVLDGLAAGIHLAHPLVALVWYALAVWAVDHATRAVPLATAAGRATEPRARARG